MKIEKIEKMKRIIIQKKTPQNYYGPWKKKHKITMAHECQI